MIDGKVQKSTLSWKLWHTESWPWSAFSSLDWNRSCWTLDWNAFFHCSHITPTWQDIRQRLGRGGQVAISISYHDPDLHRKHRGCSTLTISSPQCKSILLIICTRRGPRARDQNLCAKLIPDYPPLHCIPNAQSMKCTSNACYTWLAMGNANVSSQTQCKSRLIITTIIVSTTPSV